jgi:hypothetical protein
MLLYPVTDARQNTESIKKYIDTKGTIHGYKELLSRKEESGREHLFDDPCV